MKFEKQIFASAAAAALMLNASLLGAETPESAALKLPRRDIPWVSLKHQRELEAKAIDAAVKTAEQRAEEERKRKELERQSSFLTRFTKDSAPKVTADKFDYAQDGSGKLSASGNVVVEDKNFIANADSLEYSPKDGYALIEGNVGVSIPEARIASDRIRLDIANDAMQSDYSKFGSYPVFIETQSLSGDKKNVELKDATTYFGEPSWCSMKTSASNIKYNTETELLEMEDVTLSVGDVPFMYVPSYSQHGLKKPPFNIKNRFGMNNDYGAYISNTIYYNGLEDVSPGVLLDYYTKRSVLFGPAVEYDFSGADTWLSGWAQGAYINDHGNKDILGYDSLGRPIDHDRFFAEFRHSQMISDSVSLTGNVSYWSDEFVTRDFRPELFYDNQTPDNFAEAMYYGDFFTTSVFTRFAPNDWELVQQRLPEVRFDMQPIEILNTGAYQNFFASYAYLRESDPYALTSDFVNSNRFRVKPVLPGQVPNQIGGDKHTGAQELFLEIGQVYHRVRIRQIHICLVIKTFRTAVDKSIENYRHAFRPGAVFQILIEIAKNWHRLELPRPLRVPKRRIIVGNPEVRIGFNQCFIQQLFLNVGHLRHDNGKENEQAINLH